MAKAIEIKLSPETHTKVSEYATKKGDITLSEAVVKIVETGLSRLHALSEHAKKKAREAKAHAKDKPAKAAKAPKKAAAPAKAAKTAVKTKTAAKKAPTKAAAKTVAAPKKAAHKPAAPAAEKKAASKPTKEQRLKMIQRAHKSAEKAEPVAAETAEDMAAVG